jgi:hypothetical protein
VFATGTRAATVKPTDGLSQLRCKPLVFKQNLQRIFPACFGDRHAISPLSADLLAVSF